MGWSAPRRYEFEDPEPILGPGVSRAKATDRTKDYRLLVMQPGKPAMRITIPAPNQAKAMSYCQNRWPNATVTLDK